ncbi:hypothetical protein JXL19_04760 [bacterium]|nr:hypothetical protein [bacterium]
MVLLLVGISRYYIALLNEIPQGVDPTFNCVLAKKIFLTRGMIFNWEPFENIKVNYPLGSHILVAILSCVSCISIHNTYRFLLPALGVLTTSQIYILALSYTKKREIALFSAIAYGFWAVYGSIHYSSWGGIPNMIGMSFWLICLYMLNKSGFSLRQKIFFGLIYAALILTHHHVFITSGFLFLVMIVYFLFLSYPQKTKDIVYSLIIAGIFASFFLVPYIIKILTVTDTRVLKFNENLPDLLGLMKNCGFILSLFFILGFLGFNREFRKKEAISVINICIGGLLSLYIFWGFIYPQIALRIFGRPYVGFTPSRFYTDLVYFLSIPAGYTVYKIQKYLNCNVIICCIVAILFGFSNLNVWKELKSPNLPDKDLWETLRWIEKNTPESAFVLNGGSWAAYATWRSTDYLYIPISEPSNAGTEKNKILQMLRKGFIIDEAKERSFYFIRKGIELKKGYNTVWLHPSGKYAIDKLWPI